VNSTDVDVSAEHATQRLDRYLADQLGISRARVRHLLEVGRVQLGDRALELGDKSHSVAVGERFSVAGAVRAEDELPVARADRPIEIGGEGPGWIVVNKPAGWGVHPLRPDQEETVLNSVLALRPEILGVGEGGLRSGVVHRLDVDTSGALILATDDEAWQRLRGGFSAHLVEKRYHALVAGHLPRERRVDMDLEVSRHQPAHVVVRRGAKACGQHVRPLRHFGSATLIEVRLETGFLHQIRATMAHLGHPVLGDLEYWPTGEEDSIDPPIEVSRQMLHARNLIFDDVDVEIEVPADLAAAVAELEASLE